MTLEPRRGLYRISTDPAQLQLGVIHGYLTRSYWAEGVSREVVARALEHSLNFGLYLDDGGSDDGGPAEQIGFARVVSDYATFAYLADVFVLEAHRGQGLATWLIGAALAHPRLQGLRTWALFTRDAHGLYRKFGFATPDDPKRVMWRRGGS